MPTPLERQIPATAQRLGLHNAVRAHELDINARDRASRLLPAGRARHLPTKHLTIKIDHKVSQLTGSSPLDS